MAMRTGCTHKQTLKVHKCYNKPQPKSEQKIRILMLNFHTAHFESKILINKDKSVIVGISAIIPLESKQSNIFTAYTVTSK